MKNCALVSVPSFPVDWKTVELPLNETFQPYFAAVTSPSLFYLLGPSQGQKTLMLFVIRRCTNCENVILMPVVTAVCFCAVDQQKLQAVMMEVAAYCTNNQASLSLTALSRPAPGAACCAQFSGEKHSYYLLNAYITNVQRYILIYGTSITMQEKIKCLSTL